MRQQILKRTVAPLLLPVNLAEAKLDCRVDHDAEDTLIESLISAATDYVGAPNGVVGKALVSQTWKMSTDGVGRDMRVHLPITPAQSIDSISYFDSDNAEKTLTASDFYLFGDEDWAHVEPKPGISWPATAIRPDAISITFIAGFGDGSDDVPESIRQLIRMMINHWYTNRSAVLTGTISTEIPLAAQSLISINRKGWVY